MRFMFKTDYEDDIKLFPHGGYIVTYGILLAFLAVAPFVLSSYLVSQLVFVFIYATVGVGLMILTGFTGRRLRPCRLSRHRRLYRGVSAAIQRALPGLFSRRRAADRRRRRARSGSRRCGCRAFIS
jgi:hypothetical protein